MSSVRIASLKPSPAVPSRWCLGTRQPSNFKRASGCGAMTSMRSAMLKPGVPACTTKADRPRVPGCSPVRAKTQ